MTQQALTIKQDQTPIVTELTARDVFNIWLPDQSELTRTVKGRSDRFPGMGRKAGTRRAYRGCDGLQAGPS